MDVSGHDNQGVRASRSYFSSGWQTSSTHEPTLVRLMYKSAPNQTCYVPLKQLWTRLFASSGVTLVGIRSLFASDCKFDVSVCFVDSGACETYAPGASFNKCVACSGKGKTSEWTSEW